MAEIEKNWVYINEFWENKYLYIKQGKLAEKAKEFYTEDFINNYERWKNIVEDYNKDIKDYLLMYSFPSEQIEYMSFDFFCKTVISLIEEFININGDIIKEDLEIVIQKVAEEHISNLLNNYKQKTITLNLLMDSIKKFAIK